VTGSVTSIERPTRTGPAPSAQRTGAPVLPRISIVTPSFNQGRFLDETIRSVLDQNYPKIEYFVLDGGSTDESIDVIKQHAGRLAGWVSEKDKGQYDAVNKGLARSTGEVMAWLNSDDKYTPWALSVVGEIFASFPEVQWLTSLFPLHWDGAGRAVNCKQIDGFSRRAFYRGENIPRAGAPGGLVTHFIQQESTFWRRSLWEKAGGRIDATLPLAGDTELWAKFYQHADLYGVATPLGGFRMHGDQKTSHRMLAYIEESITVLKRNGGRPYTATDAAVRRIARRCLPDGLKKRLGLKDKVKVCLHRGGKWMLAETYAK
jgi:glycosyltransferase involved in cell wall biosynthesis